MLKVAKERGKHVLGSRPASPSSTTSPQMQILTPKPRRASPPPPASPGSPKGDSGNANLMKQIKEANHSLAEELVAGMPTSDCIAGIHKDIQFIMSKVGQLDALEDIVGMGVSDALNKISKDLPILTLTVDLMAAKLEELKEGVEGMQERMGRMEKALADQSAKKSFAKVVQDSIAPISTSINTLSNAIPTPPPPVDESTAFGGRGIPHYLLCIREGLSLPSFPPPSLCRKKRAPKVSHGQTQLRDYVPSDPPNRANNPSGASSPTQGSDTSTAVPTGDARAPEGGEGAASSSTNPTSPNNNSPVQPRWATPVAAATPRSSTPPPTSSRISSPTSSATPPPHSPSSPPSPEHESTSTLPNPPSSPTREEGAADGKEEEGGSETETGVERCDVGEDEIGEVEGEGADGKKGKGKHQGKDTRVGTRQSARLQAMKAGGGPQQ